MWCLPFCIGSQRGPNGEILRLLNEAAALAIRDANERITMKHLDHVGQVAV